MEAPELAWGPSCVAGAVGQEFSLDDLDSWRVVSVTVSGADYRSISAIKFSCMCRRNVGSLLRSRVSSSTRFEPWASLSVSWLRGRRHCGRFGKFFNPGPCRIHLCLSRPCVDLGEDEKLHATRIRVWSVYPTSAMVNFM